MESAGELPDWPEVVGGKSPKVSGQGSYVGLETSMWGNCRVLGQRVRRTQDGRKRRVPGGLRGGGGGVEEVIVGKG